MSAMIAAVAASAMAMTQHKAMQQCLESQVVDMQKPSLQSKGSTVEYKGHGVNTGGLQAHSVGWEYPYTIMGVQRGPEGALRWVVMDTRNGQLGADKATYKECEIEIASLKIRNMMHG